MNAPSGPLRALFPARPLRRTLFAALAGALMLAGCGQRGPLYLPDQPPAKRLSTVPATQAASTPPAAAAPSSS